MAVHIRNQRQSHRFFHMHLLSVEGHGGLVSDVHLNIVPLVDMMMVLVIFLVMNFNATGEMLFLSKDMKMPQAEHGGEVTRVPIVSISYNPEDQKRTLYFEGEPIAELNAIDPESVDWLIPELEEKLTDNRARFEAVGGERAAELNPEEDPTTTVNVQVDKSTDYMLVKRVLYTCEQAGYGRIRRAVGDGRTSSAAPGGASEEE